MSDDLARAEEIANIMLGRPRKQTLAPCRIEGLLAFPTDRSYIRGCIHLRHADFKRLLSDGLIDGVAGDCRITPLGLAVREALLRDAQP